MSAGGAGNACRPGRAGRAGVVACWRGVLLVGG